MLSPAFIGFSNSTRTIERLGYLDRFRSPFRKKDATALPDSAVEATAPVAIARVKKQSRGGSYWLDTPISDTRLDVFDREPFAHSIADTIGERDAPSSLAEGIKGREATARKLFSRSSETV
jgi:hypothetical protein